VASVSNPEPVADDYAGPYYSAVTSGAWGTAEREAYDLARRVVLEAVNSTKERQVLGPISQAQVTVLDFFYYPSVWRCVMRTNLDDTNYYEVFFRTGDTSISMVEFTRTQTRHFKFPESENS
jgi:hypothetical protein